MLCENTPGNEFNRFIPFSERFKEREADAEAGKAVKMSCDRQELNPESWRLSRLIWNILN